MSWQELLPTVPPAGVEAAGWYQAQAEYAEAMTPLAATQDERDFWVRRADQMWAGAR